MTIGVIAGLVAGRAAAQTPDVALVPVRSFAAVAPYQQPKEKDPDVPVAYRPPPGMCRVWLAGVPPTQQPAPTDCASAVRNRPSNGRVLFGDDYVSHKGARADGSRSYRFARAGGALSAWRVMPALAIDDGPPQSATFAPESIVAPGPAPATGTDAPARARAVAPGRGQDEYESGYAAGYRDAMNGRRPRFRGADRTDGGTGAYGGSGSAISGGQYAAATGAGVVIVPPGQDPRYFNNGRYAPPGRANGICLDRDGDGWCDDPRYGAPVCRDLDRDGRCDDYPDLAAAPFPSSLPEMQAGLDVQQGRGSALALRWLGTSEVVARMVNPKRTGTPYRILWFDANTNALLQSWTDLDGDGVADRVEIFRNGRRVKLLGR